MRGERNPRGRDHRRRDQGSGIVLNHWMATATKLTQVSPPRRSAHGRTKSRFALPDSSRTEQPISKCGTALATSPLHRRQEENWLDAGIRKARSCSARIGKSGWAGIGRMSSRLTEPPSVLRPQIILGTKKELPTKRLAARKLDEILFRINASSYRPIRIATIEEFAKRYREEVLSKRKPSTVRAANSHFDAHILPQLGKLRLDQIRSRESTGFCQQPRRRIEENRAEHSEHALVDAFHSQRLALSRQGDRSQEARSSRS